MGSGQAAARRSRTHEANRRHLLTCPLLRFEYPRIMKLVGDEEGIAVPEEIAVIGFDNRRESETSWPALTTVDLPLNEAGDKAAELLLAEINGVGNLSVEGPLLLRTNLVVRETT